MDRLLALASTSSLLGSRSSNSSSDKIEERIPGFSVLQNFFKQWLGLDLATLLTAAALMGAASSGAQSIQTGSSKLYWWIVRFLTASISIAGKDRLNREVLNWLGAHVLMKGTTRVLTAHSERIQSDAWYHRRVLERNDYHHEKRLPVQYLPTFGVTWFFHKRNVFFVRRVLTGSSHWKNAWDKTPDEYAGAPEGDEPLVIMCLGRSVEPIKGFLHVCREFADKQRETFVTVRASKARSYDESWDTTILRPIRPLETVHFDEQMKAELVEDIANYLKNDTRKFYNKRGIPYRRGYLLHGPPGTGKTSLSLALAGLFGLELYLVHIPSVNDDRSLEKLFASLPPRCMVLLEDIDAVGIKRRPERSGKDEDSDDDKDTDDEDDEDERNAPQSRCTLSGLLNVLDGVASQEGRIILMTSNFADKLDRALVRPGRVDSMIYLGNISQRSGELMFLRMFAQDAAGPAPSAKEPISREELEKLALEFSRKLPDDRFTPAQLQGFLLGHRESPHGAVKSVDAWAERELLAIEEAKERARKAAEKRRKRKRESRLKDLAKLAKVAQSEETDAEIKALKDKIKKHEERQKAEREKNKGSKDANENGESSGEIKEGTEATPAAHTEDPVNGELNGDGTKLEVPDKKMKTGSTAANGDAAANGNAATNGDADSSDTTSNSDTVSNGEADQNGDEDGTD